MTSPKDVKKQNDHFHRTSATSLKREIKRQVTSIYTDFLNLMECKWGTEFEGFVEIRARILRRGNDSIRYLEDLMDKKYNVQKIPDYTVVFDNQGSPQEEIPQEKVTN